MNSILSTAFTLFLIINSLGIAPIVLALLKDCKPKHQRYILFRESCIALVFILLFNFIGERFFDWLDIKTPSIQISGGIILFLIALRMIFPHLKAKDEAQLREEPFIVPIATPLLAGPATLTTVMIQAESMDHLGSMLYAIGLAWGASTLILLLAPNIKRLVGIRGLNALERLMGLILILLAVQMLMRGVASFASTMNS